MIFGIDLIPIDIPVFVILLVSLIILSFTKMYRHLLCLIISFYPSVVLYQAIPWGDLGANLRIIIYIVILIAVFSGMTRVLGHIQLGLGHLARLVDAVAIGISASFIVAIILDKVFQLKNALEIPSGTQAFLGSSVGYVVLVGVPLLVFLWLTRRG